MKPIGYINGEIGPLEDLKLPLCDRSVFYGDAVYDAVLYLNNKPFSLELHLDRLYKSCKLMAIDFRMDRNELKTEVDRLVSLWDGSSAMLYLQVTRGSAPRKHEFPKDAAPNLIMFLAPAACPPRNKKASLLPIEDLRFQYCNIKTTNLIPNVFAAQNATAAGKTEALLHRGDRVTEASHSSIMILKDGVLICPPLDELILPGITRAEIERLCKANGIPVEHRIFTVEETYRADEILLCATTKGLIYVYEIDKTSVGGKDPLLAQRIQELYYDELARQTGVTLP